MTTTSTDILTAIDAAVAAGEMTVFKAAEPEHYFPTAPVKSHTNVARSHDLHHAVCRECGSGYYAPDNVRTVSQAQARRFGFCTLTCLKQYVAGLRNC
jgi:hypothetical protein